MSGKIVKALNLLILLAGCAILGAAAHKNHQLFDFTSSIVIQIWVGMLFVYFALSGTYKLLIVFNKFFGILGLGSLIVLMLLLLYLFVPLFVTVPAGGDTTGTGWVVLVVAGWAIWDTYMLTLEETDSDQR